jgi:hypothetical protein
VKPPWEGKSKHFTEEFEAFALTLMREMPMKKVGEIVGVDDVTRRDNRGRSGSWDCRLISG